MNLFELQDPQLLIIYAGRFQPFHIGHAKVYDYLVGKFGRNNVYIATSNKVDPPRSPFSFSEKSYFMQLTGLAADRIVQCDQPYKIESLLATGRINVSDQSNTVVIFAVSEKDMAEDPRFKSWTKKDGTPAYFQPMPKDIRETEGMNHHGYVMTVPTFDFTVLGQPMRSGTELREMYINADEQQRRAIVKDLFGKYTYEAEQLMTSKLVPTDPITPPRPNKLPKPVQAAGGQVDEGIFKKTIEPQMLPLTQEQRNFIKKYFTSHNADIKWGKDGSEYVLPHNVNASYGRGRFHFRNEDGQLKVSIEHYRAPEDRANMDQMPIAHTDHIINGDKDMLALRDQLSEEGGVGVVKGGSDPRYSMATTGKQNAVKSDTLGKEMKAMGLTGYTPPKGYKPPTTGQQRIGASIGRGLGSPVKEDYDQLNAMIDDLTKRYSAKDLPSKYRDALRQRLEKLKDRRNSNT